MKYLPVCILFLLGIKTSAQKLDQYRWSNRVVILVGASTQETEMKRQRKRFLEQKEQMKERDIILLEKSPDSEALTALIPDKNFTGVLLVGKDGGLKMKKSFPVEPEIVFNLVDSMPMRKAEMRRNKNH